MQSWMASKETLTKPEASVWHFLAVEQNPGLIQRPWKVMEKCYLELRFNPGLQKAFGIVKI